MVEVWPRRKMHRTERKTNEEILQRMSAREFMTLTNERVPSCRTCGERATSGTCIFRQEHNKETDEDRDRYIETKWLEQAGKRTAA